MRKLIRSSLLALALTATAIGAVMDVVQAADVIQAVDPAPVPATDMLRGTHSPIVEAVDPAARKAWTGFVAGFSIGRMELKDYDPAFPVAPGTTIPLSTHGNANPFGIYAGYQHQFGSFVIGGEYSYERHGLQFIAPFGPLPIELSEIHGFVAKAGYASGPIHVYGLLGTSYAKLDIGLEDFVLTAGFGVDYAVGDHMVLGLRYTRNEFEEFDDTLIEGQTDQASMRLGVKF